MNILITLCARGGSKGIPGKNIKNLNGVPLLAYSINTARKFSEIVKAEVDIILSTDSEAINGVGTRLGLHTDYIRPQHLAEDSSGKLDAIIHVKEYQELHTQKKYDYLIDLDVSSPLRTVDDLLDAFEIIKNDPHALNLFSVNVANRNPYFNMVEQSENGYYDLSKKPESNVLSRQKAPKVYELNASFYFYTKAFFDLKSKYIITPNSLIYVMPHICFDLDHEVDFEFMEYLLAHDKLSFSL